MFNRFTPVQFFQQDNCFAIVHSLETEEQIPNLTVVTEAVYCRKQAPLIKVLFCDHSVTAFPSEGTGNSTIVAKYKEVLIPRMGKKQSSSMIQSTKQVSRLLNESKAVLFFIRSGMPSQSNLHWRGQVRVGEGETVEFYNFLRKWEKVAFSGYLRALYAPPHVMRKHFYGNGKKLVKKRKQA